jgi:hypothetical protein
MSRPCTRPECGGEQHTDPWGTPVQCPHSEGAATDTGRRCPRCDCPDGHEQCAHCKVCPHAEGIRTAPADDELAREKENFRRLALRLDEWVGRAEDAEAAIKRVRDFCSPEQNTPGLGYLRRSKDILVILNQQEAP